VHPEHLLPTWAEEVRQTLDQDRQDRLPETPLDLRAERLSTCGQEGQEVVGDPVVGPAGPSRVGHRYHSFDQPQRDEPVEGSDGLVAQRVLDLAVLAAAGGDGMQGR